MLSVIILSIASLISILITFTSSFDFNKLEPTCDRYVLNVYLYLVTLFVLFNLFIAIILNNKKTLLKYVNISNILYTSILFLFIYIGTFFGVLFIPKEYVILKHLVGLLYVVLSSLIFAIIYDMFGINAVIEAIIIVTIMFIILTFFAWKFQDLISSRISLSFLIIFIILVLVEFFMSLLFPSSIFTKLIIIIIIGVVCYLILVKTKKMIENQKTCEKDGGPDYIRESIGFFLSIKNILLRVLSLRRGKIRR